MHGTIFSVQTANTSAIHVKRDWLGHTSVEGKPLTHAEYVEHLGSVHDACVAAGDYANAAALHNLRMTTKAIGEKDCATCKAVRISQAVTGPRSK